MQARNARLIKLLLINLVTGFVCFLLLITHALTSDYDGLWYADAMYRSGAWELSLGRFMIPVIDYLRMGYNGEPFQSLLTLLLLSAGNVLLLVTCDAADSKYAVPVLALLTVNTTVCIFLSYRYTAPAYGLSYLLSVLSVYLLVRFHGSRKRDVTGMVLSALTLTLCLGTYQAHLGCTCLLIVCLCLKMTYRAETSLRDILRFLVKSAVSAVAACALYKIIWDITLRVTGNTRPDYRGAGDLSVGKILRGVPYGIRQTFRFFRVHLFTTDNRYSLFQETPVHTLILAAFAVLLVFTVYRAAKTDARKGVCAALSVICLPVAACVFCLLDIETGFVSTQMTLPYTMMAPLLLLVFADVFSLLPAQKKPVRYVKGACAVLCFLLLYGRIYQTGIDEYVMFEGTRTTRNLVQSAVTRVLDEGYYSPDRKIMPVGVPAENPLFEKSALFEQANGYARFGAFWKGPYSYRRSYGGLFRSTGIAIPFPDLETFVALMETEEVKNMPVYPDAGSILLLDDVIVVKFANE
ncbi:MAG: glucosyltransferase domain-containing protein [Lachnospiraceae bacterium]|nr:glucosyltransferase domain-containing protein [Lachnospiraceae bacterium]